MHSGKGRAHFTDRDPCSCPDSTFEPWKTGRLMNSLWARVSLCENKTYFHICHIKHSTHIYLRSNGKYPVLWLYTVDAQYMFLFLPPTSHWSWVYHFSNNPYYVPSFSHWRFAPGSSDTLTFQCVTKMCLEDQTGVIEPLDWSISLQRIQRTTMGMKSAKSRLRETR